MSGRLPQNTNVGTGKTENSGEMHNREQREDGDHKEILQVNFAAKEGPISQTEVISYIIW